MTCDRRLLVRAPICKISCRSGFTPGYILVDSDAEFLLMSDSGAKHEFAYHEATKHTAEKLRSSPHMLDWANMPKPFRHYEGIPLIDLPAEPPSPKTRHWMFFGVQREARVSLVGFNSCPSYFITRLPSARLNVYLSLMDSYAFAGKTLPRATCIRRSFISPLVGWWDWATASTTTGCHLT